MDGYTFTATDGRKYRTTGEFRCARHNEYLVQAPDWHPAKAEVRPCIGDATMPSIIVTPVEVRYEVTVRLTEEQMACVKAHMELAVAPPHCTGHGRFDAEVFKWLYNAVMKQQLPPATGVIPRGSVGGAHTPARSVHSCSPARHGQGGPTSKGV